MDLRFSIFDGPIISDVVLKGTDATGDINSLTSNASSFYWVHYKCTYSTILSSTLSLMAYFRRLFCLSNNCIHCHRISLFMFKTDDRDLPLLMSPYRLKAFNNAWSSVAIAVGCMFGWSVVEVPITDIIITSLFPNVLKSSTNSIGFCQTRHSHRWSSLNKNCFQFYTWYATIAYNWIYRTSSILKRKIWAFVL